jgi:hypothetical protein
VCVCGGDAVCVCMRVSVGASQLGRPGEAPNVVSSGRFVALQSLADSSIKEV